MVLPARHGLRAYSTVVVRRIRIAEATVRFCLGPRAMAGGSGIRIAEARV